VKPAGSFSTSSEGMSATIMCRLLDRFYSGSRICC
jgi:hypothetical protein